MTKNNKNTNKKIIKRKSTQPIKVASKIRHLKACLLILSAALALVTIITSLFEFRYRAEPQGLALFLFGLIFSSMAPAYYIVSRDTPKLLRIFGIIVFNVLLVFAGVIITVILSFAFLYK